MFCNCVYHDIALNLINLPIYASSLNHELVKSDAVPAHMKYFLLKLF